MDLYLLDIFWLGIQLMLKLGNSKCQFYWNCVIIRLISRKKKKCFMSSFFNSMIFAVWVSPGCSNWSSGLDCSYTGSSDQPSYWYWIPVCCPCPTSCSSKMRYRSRGQGSTSNWVLGTQSEWSSLRRGSSQFQFHKTPWARRSLFQGQRDGRPSKPWLGGCFWSR